MEKSIYKKWITSNGKVGSVIKQCSDGGVLAIYKDHISHHAMLMIDDEIYCPENGYIEATEEEFNEIKSTALEFLNSL